MLKHPKSLERGFIRLVVTVALVALGAPQRALATPIINFETLPSLPAQPNNFVAAGPMQTYSAAGLFSVTGGVALGNPTSLASFAAHGSSPNLYGTADFGDPTLLNTITFVFPASALVTGISGVLFNGQPIAEDYVLTFFSPTNVPLGTISAPGMAPSNSVNDFFNFSFSAGGPIGALTITTPHVATNGWDFFVDSVALQQGPSAPVPEPASMLLLGTGLVGMGTRRWRNRHQRG